MPELPEVEIVVRELCQQGVVGTRIRDVLIHVPSIITGSSVTSFRRNLLERTIKAIVRRGKYIILVLDNKWHLLIHLRMTGKLRMEKEGFVLGKHDHIVVVLEQERVLVYNDTRKFGRFQLVPPDQPLLPRLGPEPLEKGFTPGVLQAMLAERQRVIKALLLDQHMLAGLGNIYVDEALWLAGIHPETPAGLIPADKIPLLHHAICHVLQQGIKNCGTTLGQGLDNFYSVAGRRGNNAEALQVFRRDGLPCFRCGSMIERKVVAQRGTHICPCCQPLAISKEET